MKTSEKVKPLKSEDKEGIGASIKTGDTLPESPDTNTEIKKVDESVNPLKSTILTDNEVKTLATDSGSVADKPKHHKRYKRKKTDLIKENDTIKDMKPKKNTGFRIGLVIGVVLGGLGLYFLIMKLREQRARVLNKAPVQVQTDSFTELPKELNLSS